MHTLLDVHLAKSIIDKTEYTKPKRSKSRRNHKSDVRTMMRQHSQKNTKLTYIKPIKSQMG